MSALILLSISVSVLILRRSNASFLNSFDLNKLVLTIDPSVCSIINFKTSSIKVFAFVRTESKSLFLISV